MTIRVITLQEPWASLVREGIKTIETRSWPCYQYGSLYIHAGKAVVKKNDSRRLQLSEMLKEPLKYGNIIAKCQLTDCILIDEKFANQVRKNNPKCYSCGDFSIGRYAWILSDIQPIDPIPSQGKLGLWFYESSKKLID